MGLLALSLAAHFASFLSASIVFDAFHRQAKFFVLHPPEDLQRVQGHLLKCEYFGHMYSFEMMYPDFFENNPSMLASTAEDADFIIVPHCITYVYHMLRYGSGFNTVALTWEAMKLAQVSYLLPIIQWAKNTSVYQLTGGRNFVIVFSLDKGRADYPLVSRATRNWHAVTTVGNGSTWMRENRAWLVKDHLLYGSDDVCKKHTSSSKRRLIFYNQDIVVPVPTAFWWSNRSETMEDRHLLVFYAGSPNSCIRRHIVNSLVQTTDEDVMIATDPLPRAAFSDFLYRSRFCLVPDGFSSISARLYEVMIHGCVPVIVGGEQFHPPFEELLDWKHLGIFVRRTEVPNIPVMLRMVEDSRYRFMHRELVKAHRFWDTEDMMFWRASNTHLNLRQRAALQEA